MNENERQIELASQESHQAANAARIAEGAMQQAIKAWSEATQRWYAATINLNLLLENR